MSRLGKVKADILDKMRQGWILFVNTEDQVFLASHFTIAVRRPTFRSLVQSGYIVPSFVDAHSRVRYILAGKYQP